MKSMPEKSEAPVAVTTEASSVKNPAITQGIDMQNSTALTIGTTIVRQVDDLYSLNDLHKASGEEPRHRPAEFVRLAQTQDLIAELVKGGDSHLYINTIKGRNGGTYACKELVIAYAAWISAAFHLKVIRVFLDTVQPVAPATIDYTRISPVQKQDLHEIVQAIVAAGIQTYGETWARFHRKFRINKYEELPASQYEQARSYLIAKLPSGYAGQELHDAATFDLTDTQRVELAFSTSAEAGANVQRTVFQAMMSGKNADWRRARYLLTLGYDRDGQATLPYAKVLADGQLVASLPELTQYIAKADIMPSDTQLTALASACMQRLSERAQVREGRPSRYATTLNEATIARA